MVAGSGNIVGGASPRVSVLIPMYNREKVIAETIASVLGQTFSDFELLVCDDCSTDGSVGIVLSFDDPRITLLRNDRNLGSSATRNRLISHASGEYCALLDSDDIALPWRLEKQVAFLDTHPDIGACAGAVQIIDGDGSEQRGRVWYKKAASHDLLKVKILFHCAVAQTTLMFRRREFLDAGLCYVDGPANDMGLFKHALHKMKFENLGIPLVKYRVWSSQMSTDAACQREMAMEHLYYQYDLLGVELSEKDKDVLRVAVTGGRIPMELSDDFENLAVRIAMANRNKLIFDQQALVAYLLCMYRGIVKMARKKGIGSRMRYLCRYKRFKKRLAAI